MKMRTLLVPALVLALTPFARADGVADYARAQLLFAKVMNITQQYKQVAGAVGAASAATSAAPAIKMPVPTPNKTGKYYLPYNEKGELAEWANKAIAAHVGAAVGSKVGEKAGQAALSKVPFAGGLLAGGIKKKSKEIGAMAAVGGADLVKSSSAMSFANINDFAVYLHLNYAGDPNYVKALAASLALYPDLEKNYESAIQRAYKGA